MLTRAQAPDAAPSVRLRFQSTWPADDIFHEYARDFTTKVDAMSGGRLRIDLLPADAVVKPYDVLDAVSKGVLDGGHGSLAYWYSKHPALSLWGSGPAFGMDPNMLLAWHEFGGGKALLEEIYRGLNVNVVSFLYGPMPTQPLGWFRKPITRPEDLKGLRIRAVGPAIDLFAAMGASVSTMPAAEAEQAMSRGQLDGTNLGSVSSSMEIALSNVARVCMLRSFHQAAENFEVLCNRRRFDELSPEHKAIIRHAVQACSAEMSWKAIDRYSKDYGELQDRRGVTFMPTPDSVLRAQLKAWDEVAAKRAADSASFRKVQESMRTFAQRAARWQNDTLVDYRMAYDHYFAPRKT